MSAENDRVWHEGYGFKHHSLRRWWVNCASDPDEEILAIDAMEDSITPLDDQTAKIRRLITSLELCHHKAKRYVEVIIEAIGAGGTTKGPGTRPPGQRHPVEEVWWRSAAALSAWCAGCPAQILDFDVGRGPASQLISFIGDRSPLKEWQVQRIADKVREFVVWPRSYHDPSFRYVGISECPEYYREHSDFRDLTMQTVVHDTVDGQDAEVTLASAIDSLEPCHWNFVGNLVIILKAIGGDLFPKKPFAVCARNIKLTPIRGRMKIVSNALRAFCEGEDMPKEIDTTAILRVLGARTPAKHWLAASLEKTIRLQLGF